MRRPFNGFSRIFFAHQCFVGGIYILNEYLYRIILAAAHVQIKLSVFLSSRRCLNFYMDNYVLVHVSIHVAGDFKKKKLNIREFLKLYFGLFVCRHFLEKRQLNINLSV